MCNQCSDLRRMHGNQITFLVMCDGKAVMQFASRNQAERAKALLQSSQPTSEWEIIQAQNVDIKWE